jgi:hypothetical protein
MRNDGSQPRPFFDASFAAVRTPYFWGQLDWGNIHVKHYIGSSTQDD